MNTLPENKFLIGEEKFRHLLTQAPVLIALFNGPSFIVETINKTALEIWDKTYEQVINKPLFESSPELEDGLKGILNNIYTTGEPFIANEMSIQLKRTGKSDTVYFNSIYQPLRDLDNIIYGIILIGTEVTEAVNARKLIEASEKRFSNILSQSLMAIAIFKGPQMIVTFANEPMLTALGKGNAVLNKPLTEGVPELKGQIFPQLLADVYTTGVPFEAFETKAILVRKEISVDAYFNFVYQPYRDIDDTITGITVLATEVTEHVNAKKLIEESEHFNRMVLESSPDCLKILDMEGRIQYMNYNGLCQMEIDDFSTVKNQKWWTLWGSENEALVKASIDKALGGESAQFTAFCPTAKGTPKWWDVVISPVGKTGEKITQIISVSRDITEQKNAERKIADSEVQFRTLADSIPQLAWIANADGWIYWYNQRWYDYTGTTLKEMEGWGWGKVHHPDHIESVTELVKVAWQKGEAFEMTFPLRRNDGIYRWFLTRAYPVKDTRGNIERWVGTNTDITEQKSFTEELERKVKERTINLHIQNETFKQAEESSMQGSYSFNLTTGKLASTSYRVR